jgi:hypothetical protein
LSQDERKEKRRVFTSVEMDNFESEVTMAQKPVLLACIRRGFELKGQIELLEMLSDLYGHTIKICIVYEEYNEAYRALNIEGTPTFLMFFGGEEKGRMLGNAKTETLSAFVAEFFQQQTQSPGGKPSLTTAKQG